MKLPFFLLAVLTTLRADPGTIAPVDLLPNGGVNPIGTVITITGQATTVSRQTIIQLGTAQPLLETVVAVPPRPSSKCVMPAGRRSEPPFSLFPATLP